MAYLRDAFWVSLLLVDWGRERNALVALALLSEKVLGGDLEVVKVERAGGGSADTEL